MKVNHSKSLSLSGKWKKNKIHWTVLNPVMSAVTIRTVAMCNSTNNAYTNRVKNTTKKKKTLNICKGRPQIKRNK